MIIAHMIILFTYRLVVSFVEDDIEPLLSGVVFSLSKLSND